MASGLAAFLCCPISSAACSTSAQRVKFVPCLYTYFANSCIFKNIRIKCTFRLLYKILWIYRCCSYKIDLVFFSKVSSPSSVLGSGSQISLSSGGSQSHLSVKKIMWFLFMEKNFKYSIKKSVFLIALKQIRKQRFCIMSI